MPRLQTLPDDVAQLLEPQGVEVVAVQGLGVPWPAGAKATWWVRFTDGSEAKARVFRTPSQMERFLVLRQVLGDHPGLSRVLGAQGRALLEEWVPGATLEGIDPDQEQLEQAAALLAALHRAIPPQNLPPGWSRAVAPDALAGSLAQLHEAGALTAGEAEALTAMLYPLHVAPRTQAILHGDFCGENLVSHATRGMVSIDHEWLEVGPAEYDLGRCFQRWGLAPAARQDFLRAYREVGGPATVTHIAAWELAAEIISAGIRVTNGRPGADIPLQALRRRLEQ